MKGIFAELHNLWLVRRPNAIRFFDEKKLRRARLGFFARKTQWVKDHYIRSAFIFLGMYLCYRYEIPKKIASMFFPKERHGLKFDRWIFGTQNYPPESLLEFTESIHAGPYAEIDKQLRFGLSWKFLQQVWKKMGIYNKEDKAAFFKKSGYILKINQLTCGIALDKLVEENKEAFKKLEDGGGYGSFENFMQNFWEVAYQILPEFKQKEQKIFNIRKEVISLRPANKTELQKYFIGLLIKDILITPDQIDYEMAKMGYSVSDKYKLWALTIQLKYLMKIIKAKEDERDSLNASKKNRKIALLMKQASAIQAEIQALSNSTKKTFTKPVETYFALPK